MKKLVPGIKVMERPVHGPVHGSVHGPVHGPVMVGTIRMQPPPGSEVHHMPHRGLVSHHEWSEGVHLESGPRSTLARSVL